MKTIPIAFSTPMVQAILNGNKTQTRREVKALAGCTIETMNWEDEDGNEFPQPVHSNSMGVSCSLLENLHLCPYGKVGDVLWVREEHLIKFSDDRKWISITFKDDSTIRYYYKDLSLNLLKKLYKRKTIGKWQRARFLPKELARIFLEVTNIRVERLRDISEKDAISEGIEKWENALPYADKGSRDLFKVYNESNTWSIPIYSFASLWESINGEGSFDANPWVWVIEFKRIEKPDNFLQS